MNLRYTRTVVHQQKTFSDDERDQHPLHGGVQGKRETKATRVYKVYRAPTVRPCNNGWG